MGLLANAPQNRLSPRADNPIIIRLQGSGGVVTSVHSPEVDVYLTKPGKMQAYISVIRLVRAMETSGVYTEFKLSSKLKP